jgi:hypothetical protein
VAPTTAESPEVTLPLIAFCCADAGILTAAIKKQVKNVINRKEMRGKENTGVLFRRKQFSISVCFGIKKFW